MKSPSHFALIENLVCNQAGSGISIGSLNVSAEISNIVSDLVRHQCYLQLRVLTIRLGSPKHQHHPRKQYCLHQDLPGRLGLRDKRDILKLSLSFQSLRPQHQSVLAEYLPAGYWRCILE